MLSPEAVRGDRGGEPSGPEGSVLVFPRSSLLSWGMGEEPASPTPRSGLVSSRVHVTMSVFSSNGRGNLPPAGGEG